MLRAFGVAVFVVALGLIGNAVEDWRGWDGHLHLQDDNFILDQDMLFNNTRLSQLSFPEAGLS
jgi:hypothetical protein